MYLIKTDRGILYKGADLNVVVSILLATSELHIFTELAVEW
jgi:hypothetical protein